MRKKVSMPEAAFRLLVKANKPMHYRDLTDTALKRKMFVTEGETPDQSLLAAVRAEIKRKGNKARFCAIGRGIYSLSRHGRKLAKG